MNEDAKVLCALLALLIVVIVVGLIGGYYWTRDTAALMESFATGREVLPQFDDVPSDHWAYEEIELIHSYGVTVGCSYDPPLYCPDRPATRAEMAVFAARILEIIEDD